MRIGCVDAGTAAAAARQLRGDQPMTRHLGVTIFEVAAIRLMRRHSSVFDSETGIVSTICRRSASRTSREVNRRSMRTAFSA
jgi:hypothetical protein